MLLKKNGDTDIYEVDYIMGHKEGDGGFEYHVKWKGYDKSDSTWEPEEHINDPQSIERYFRLLALKQTTKPPKPSKRRERR